MGNCNNCDCNEADRLREFDDNKIEPISGVMHQPQFKRNESEKSITKPMQRNKSNTMGGPPQHRSNQNSGVYNNVEIKQSRSISSSSQYQPDSQRIKEIDVKKVIKIQAFYRGCKARVMAQMLKKQLKVKKKYFLEEEFYETIDKNNHLSIQLIKKADSLVTRNYQYNCTGAQYEGQWLGGFRHGRGTMTWSDDAKYEGEWSLGRAHGQGKFTHTQGEIYEGTWKYDKAHGIGTYIHSNGALYQGGWNKDLQNGFGTEQWPDSSKFTGEYREGRKNGLGRYVWADGAIYEGQWDENEIAGYGHYQWSDGRKYLGHWKGNIMDDFGIYTWQDGRMYEGFYKDDKKHGYGIYTWSDNKKYSGWWHQGKQHGIGIFVSKEGGKKKYGVWEDGKKVKWFKPQEVQLIESDEYLDAQSFFVDQPYQSSQKIKNFARQFHPPGYFYQSRESLVNKIKELKIAVDVPLLVVDESLQEEEEEQESIAERNNNNN